jgi:ATP-binding protein involved in chromosome partitioning
MQTITEEAVLQALRRVQDPDLKRDIVSLGFVKKVEIDGSSVAVEVELTTPACPVKEELRSECEAAIRDLGGVKEVLVEMTARVRDTMDDVELIPGVRNVIAVASGKGGVGKSTVAANLAIALRQSGATVGLMDADVYGPTIPLLLGCRQARPAVVNGKILPIERYGVRVMSLGFLLEEGQAVLWRGPMVAGTVRQLLADVDWGELDYLVVDLPPGTGDAPMSLAQLVPVAGVVLVITPHDVASQIAGHSVELFKRMNTSLLGIVENMATFICPGCGTEVEIFGSSKGEEVAKRFQTRLLGRIPLDPSVSQSGDAGMPIVIQRPESPATAEFERAAGEIAREVSKRAYAEKDLIRELK